MINQCIRQDVPCIGKEKFIVNGKVACCKEELEDEYNTVQSVLDAIDDYCTGLDDCLTKVCSRISYASNIISLDVNHEYFEVLNEFKRFAILVYEYKEKISSQEYTLNLTSSFIQVVNNWFIQVFMQEKKHYSIDSIKADLSTLEMALGICMLAPSTDEDFDDIFF